MQEHKLFRLCRNRAQGSVTHYLLIFQNCYGEVGEVKKGPFHIRDEKTEALFEGAMISNGIPNGYCRVISPDGDLDFFGCFVNGSLVGNCWKGLMGGNF